MRTFSLTAFAALSLAAVHAAPAKQLQRAKLSCDWDNKLPGAQLSAGDYNYGSKDFDVGYKSFTQEDGEEILRVVKVDPNDATISPLSSVIQVSCNSTALNYYVHRGQFGANTPVKLLADVGRHGIPYCVGIHDPDTDPTDIVLVPCSDYDDESQANQFWLEQFKYDNLFPLVGKSNTSANVEHSNSWPILIPADDANPQVFRAGHSADEQALASFIRST
ncbi:hypothetical protein EX895_004129 [Sporisorium graminicola]|uniref:Uncharacterized protein n=1 Tax=Sporisorium graminicola TaxID=280036 RepID=A0A4U7KV20_9BASI|nr:hypothetical protein EX895_004129 [Sporisorium graminicola]TKY86842.1 hypothetical protein EX895_004129 [Sporisorium graminicola]